MFMLYVNSLQSIPTLLLVIFHAKIRGQVARGSGQNEQRTRRMVGVQRDDRRAQAGGHGGLAGAMWAGKDQGVRDK